MCVVSELLSSCTSGQLIRCSHKEAVRDTGCGGDQRRPPEQRSCPQASPEERGDEEERRKGQRGSATARSEPDSVFLRNPVLSDSESARPSAQTRRGVILNAGCAAA